MKNFKNVLTKPARESQPWVTWIWNLQLTKTEMLEQLSSFLSQGFGGIAIRPGRDMIPSYLSEEFFELFGIVLQSAQEKNVGIRIADDFSLPWSGVFDEVIFQSKKLRAQQLVLTETIPVSGQNEITIANVDSDTLVLAVRLKDEEVNPNEIKILTSKTVKTPLVWKAPPGDWSVLVFRNEFVCDPAGGYIPNVFNPKVAQVYIQTVLEQFKSHFSKFIPGTFEGFINEMPAYCPAGGGIPWDEDLEVKFRGKYKKDLIKLLPALYCENYPGAQKIRQQVYDFITQATYERFAVPLEAWAKKNRMSQWVLCADRCLYKQSNSLNYGFLPHESELGTVGIQNLDGTEENYPLLRSVADSNDIQFRRNTVTVLGRNRSGNGSTLQSLKNEVDLSLSAGFSKILIDGAYFNIDRRSYVKTPYNPAWYSPGWEQIKSLCEYIARSSELVKGVHTAKQIAVLSPSSAVIAGYLPTNNESVDAGTMLLEKTIAALDRLNLPYDIITDEYLESCTMRSNGELSTADRIRKGNYQALIIPYAPFISKAVLGIIEKLAQKENRVFFIDNAPKGTFEDGVSSSITSRIEKLIDPKKNKVEIVSSSAIEESLKSISPTVSIKVNDKRGSDVFCTNGSGDGFELYILRNNSVTRDYSITIELPSDKYFAIVDCNTGELSEIENIQRQGNTSLIKMSISPCTTFFIISSATRIAAQGSGKHYHNGVNPFTISQRNYRIVMKDQWTFETKSLNALPLANWNVRIGLSKETGGFSHFYESNFQAKSLPTICYFVTNGIGCADSKFIGTENSNEININGARIDRMSAAVISGPKNDEKQNPGVPLFSTMEYEKPLQRLFGSQIINIKDVLICGFNRISIRTSGLISDPRTILYPPVILGDFGIVKGQNGWAIDTPNSLIGHDSWTKYGYPYLSGVGIYRQSFEIPHEYNKIILRFSQVSGAVSAHLNDKPLGIFNWHPMEVDVTSICDSNRNELVIEVLNTVDNLVKLNGRPSGLIGEVFLDIY